MHTHTQLQVYPAKDLQPWSCLTSIGMHPYSKVEGAVWVGTMVVMPWLPGDGGLHGLLIFIQRGHSLDVGGWKYQY